MIVGNGKSVVCRVEQQAGNSLAGAEAALNRWNFYLIETSFALKAFQVIGWGTQTVKTFT